MLFFAEKRIFYLHISKKCCNFALVIPRRRDMSLIIGWYCRHIRAFIDACFGLTESSKFESPKQDGFKCPLGMFILYRICVGINIYRRGRYSLFLDEGFARTL